MLNHERFLFCSETIQCHRHMEHDLYNICYDLYFRRVCSTLDQPIRISLSRPEVETSTLDLRLYPPPPDQIIYTILLVIKIMMTIILIRFTPWMEALDQVEGLDLIPPCLLLSNQFNHDNYDDDANGNDDDNYDDNHYDDDDKSIDDDDNGDDDDYNSNYGDDIGNDDGDNGDDDDDSGSEDDDNSNDDDDDTGDDDDEIGDNYEFPGCTSWMVAIST